MMDGVVFLWRRMAWQLLILKVNLDSVSVLILSNLSNFDLFLIQRDYCCKLLSYSSMFSAYIYPFLEVGYPNFVIFETYSIPFSIEGAILGPY